MAHKFTTQLERPSTLIQELELRHPKTKGPFESIHLITHGYSWVWLPKDQRCWQSVSASWPATRALKTKKQLESKSVFQLSRVPVFRIPRPPTSSDPEHLKRSPFLSFFSSPSLGPPEVKKKTLKRKSLFRVPRKRIECPASSHPPGGCTKSQFIYLKKSPKNIHPVTNWVTPHFWLKCKTDIRGQCTTLFLKLGKECESIKEWCFPAQAQSFPQPHPTSASSFCSPKKYVSRGYTDVPLATLKTALRQHPLHSQAVTIDVIDWCYTNSPCNVTLLQCAVLQGCWHRQLWAMAKHMESSSHDSTIWNEQARSWPLPCPISAYLRHSFVPPTATLKT